MKKLITYIKSNFHYNPNTGQLWRLFSHCSKLMDLKAKWGHISVRITIDKKVHHTYAHRIIWVLHYGTFPSKKLVIDHINRNPADNRISNLRAITQAENCRNKSSRIKRPKTCPHCGFLL